MILSDNSIMNRLCCEEDDPKRLVIEPFSEEYVGPASYDISLGNSFLLKRKDDKPIDIHKNCGGYRRVTSDQFILYPNNFVLATTIEYISLPNDIAAFVQGRSSVGRLGLNVQDAGFIDPGFSGEITLELYNFSRVPIPLEKGMRIAQLVFYETYPCSKTYNGKYKGQHGATPSLIFKDYKEKNNE